MPDPYQLELTAAQINQAINAAYDSDQAPSLGDTNLVNSDKIAAALAAEASARATVASDLAALDARVVPLEGFAYGQVVRTSYLILSSTGYVTTADSSYSNDGVTPTEADFSLTAVAAGTYLVVLDFVRCSLAVTGSSDEGYLSIYLNGVEHIEVARLKASATGSPLELTSFRTYMTLSASDIIRLHFTEVNNPAVFTIYGGDGGGRVTMTLQKV